MTTAIILNTPSYRAIGESRFLGLGLLERIVRNLLKEGFSAIYVVGELPALPQDLDEKVRFSSGEFSRELFESEELQQQDLLIIPAHVVYHPALPQKLIRQSEQRNASVLHGIDRPEEAITHLRVAEQTSLGAFEGYGALVEALSSAAHNGIAFVGSEFRIALSDPQARKEARRALMKTNWRPHDGIVARLLNKHLSVAISVALADSPITPNIMTTIAFAFALVGLFLTALGGYWGFFIGALLIQIQSVLDGCDGELARMRYQSSRLGAWYDTVVDDIIGVVWVATLGIGVMNSGGHYLWAIGGVMTAMLYGVAVGLIYIALIRAKAEGHQDFVWFFEEGAEPQVDYPDTKAFSTWLKYAMRRDFYVLFFFILSLLGLISAASLIASAGALGWFVAMMVQLSKRGMAIRPAPEEPAT